MKTIIIAFALLCCGVASANDWDVLRESVQKSSGCDIGSQSSSSERYDPPNTVVVETYNAPTMPEQTQSSIFSQESE
jgi:hypothetical protein